MAQNGSSSSRQNKRLARARVAPMDGGGPAAKGRAGKGASPKGPSKPKPAPAEVRRARKRRTMEIVVVAFAVIMALSMMLPSLASIFANKSSSSVQEQSTGGTDDSTSEGSPASSDAASSSSETKSGVEAADAKYSAAIASLESRLEGDPDNLATLLNLGDSCMSWAYSVSRSSATDADKSHANDLYARAIGYFDRYLALNDSNAVRVDRALCQYYSGDADAAKTALEELTQGSAADYGPAWANLGLLYESSRDADAARSAYGRAAETDPDDEYGAKSFAETRLAALNVAQNSASSTSSTSAGPAADGTAAGLSDALANASGTTL